MSVIIRRRAKRALVPLCASFLLLAFAASAGVQDARVLWVTLPGSVLRVAPLDGSVATQLAGLKQPGALAVEGTDDTVWIYGQKDILGYDAQGNLLVSLPLPKNFHGGAPAGMAVDNAAGNIWIAIKKDLYRLDMGGTLTLIDANGVQYQAVLDVVVQDPAQMDAMFKTIWGDMTAGPASGNKGAAMSVLDYTAQQNYGPVFDTLMPNMQTIVGSFSPLMQSTLSTTTAEYTVARTRNNQAYLYFVYFSLGEDGIWRLDSM